MVLPGVQIQRATVPGWPLIFASFLLVHRIFPMLYNSKVVGTAARISSASSSLLVWRIGLAHVYTVASGQPPRLSLTALTAGPRRFPYVWLQRKLRPFSPSENEAAVLRELPAVVVGDRLEGECIIHVPAYLPDSPFLHCLQKAVRVVQRFLSVCPNRNDSCKVYARCLHHRTTDFCEVCPQSDSKCIIVDCCGYHAGHCDFSKPECYCYCWAHGDFKSDSNLQTSPLPQKKPRNADVSCVHYVCLSARQVVQTPDDQTGVVCGLETLFS